MKKIAIFFLLLIIVFTSIVFDADAHRSGCHRWHSCPSDSGSYTCGDAGHPCLYPTYPASGGVIYPPSGYYKDCYDCPLKKVPNNSYTSGIGWLCNNGYEKVGNTCQKIKTSTLSIVSGDYDIGLKAGWLIKNKKFAEVFYVNNDLCLQWIINEKVAAKNFGNVWWQKVKEYEEIPNGYKFCKNLE